VGRGRGGGQECWWGGGGAVTAWDPGGGGGIRRGARWDGTGGQCEVAMGWATQGGTRRECR
jgi:hypothetical protein